MRLPIVVVALAAPFCAASAQIATPPPLQLEQAALQPGVWTYRTQAGATDALFLDGSGQPRVTFRCTRATRRVSIGVSAPAAVGALTVWTSAGQRTLSARFDQLQVVADVPAMDAVLDAIAFSRGRFALSIAGSAPVVVPAAPEVGRIVEDCRS